MSHILKMGKSKIKVQVNSVPGEDSSPGLQMAAFLLCPHMAFSLCVPIPGLSSFYEDTRETPGGPVVRTLHFHFKGHGFSPW